MSVLYLQEQRDVETTTSLTVTSIRSTIFSLRNKHFNVLLQQECVVQVNFLVPSSCVRQNPTANQQPTTSTSANKHRLGDASTTSTSIRCRSSCATVRLTTEHSTSTTSMDRDITATAVSEMDTRLLCLRDDTSGHGRRLESQYSDKQLARTYTATSTTSGLTTSDIDHKIHQHWVRYIQRHDFDSERCVLMIE